MTNRVAVVLLAVVAALAFAAPATAGLAVQPEADESARTTGPAAQAGANNTSNASLGAEVSAFMQASAADTEGEVDNGMFAAAFNRSDEGKRAALVTNRTSELRDRLDALRSEREALLDQEGNLTVAERAKAASLTARIDALDDSIDQTETAAQRVGVDASQLDELRTEARDLAGPEVAAMATDVAARGPPGDRGPPISQGPNATDGPGADRNETETGPSDGAGTGNGTGDGVPGNGPPDDAGDGSDGGTGNGPPDDAGDGPPGDGADGQS